MFKGKKIAGVLVTVAMVTCLPLTAFAGSNSTSTKGYGTLYGNLSSSGSYVTSVSKNEDRAYLTIGGTIQDKNGNTIEKQQNISSSRGDTYFSGSWRYIPSNAYALYGAHGVQGGSTYGAAAVYTYTHA
ncbi:hypothetical protein [Lacrimispora defluvii]|uniref:Uncharacterized protein n=1 Tax=Lacrimispora defluvii TaxID=2719233 RepID=A0ABX1VMX6_9FIRM|nr:hypothetical protein [Lacrimispora defluvii]NNJ29508.1 hypothetical protein [Lacrimispora defluvii]